MNKLLKVFYYIFKIPFKLVIFFIFTIYLIVSFVAVPVMVMAETKNFEDWKTGVSKFYRDLFSGFL